MSAVFSLAFVAQVLRIAVPYVLAALGGTVCERAGVVNIALEGLLLAGGFGAVAGTLATGSALLGLLAGIAAALALSAVHGLAVIRLRADAIVSGVATTLLASGLTRFVLQVGYGSASNSPRISVAGGALLLPLTVLLVGAAHVFLWKTRAGLRLRVAGERPAALRALGLSVDTRRWAGVLASGALAGLGGVWLAFDQHGFVAGMSAGRGFIALAAMILGGWRPVPVALACLLFGGVEALELRLQDRLGAAVLQALPHLITIAALAFYARRVVAPGALDRGAAGEREFDGPGGAW